MFVALAATVAIGALIAVATILDERLRIADDLSVALLVCVSGAVAGWALIDTVGGLGTDSLDAWDLGGAATGALVIAQAAWRGRRRTFNELGLTPHSE
ncbi:MAG: hypothetical protein JHD16_16000 [Solirubrobacteraceae bacterium]|nr:hypothetical protein [Solirubrobacteraceae bacterium]